jgi:hypothetical protein
MIKLTFNTTEKEVMVRFDDFQSENYSNVSTVQIREGYYEVMIKSDEKSKPVLRVPISNTIMFIEE